MKIYHIISSFFPLIGGAERATHNLCRALIDRAYDAEVITTWYPGLKRIENINGVPIVRVGWVAYGKLRSLTFGIQAFLYLCQRRTTVELIHVQNIDTPLLIGFLLKITLRKPLIATLNGDRLVSDKLLTILGRLRISLMMILVDQFTTVSLSGKSGLLRANIPAEKITIIPNGIDTEFFRPPEPLERRSLRIQYGYDDTDTILLFLGRLIYSKRADLLVAALKEVVQHKNVKCIIVGEGPERDSLLTQTQELGLNSLVKFVGSVENVRDYYWISDIFVQPSQFEGLSVALLESMACGLCAVVSTCEGNLELIVNGENGLTFQIDDLGSLNEKLCLGITNQEMRQLYGQISRLNVMEKYSMETVAQRYIELYDKVI